MRGQHRYRPGRTVPAGVLIYRKLREAPEPFPRPRSLFPGGRIRVVVHEPFDPLPGGLAAAPEFPSFSGELLLVGPQDSRSRADPSTIRLVSGPVAVDAGGRAPTPTATSTTTRYLVRWPA